jgi:hypothetical protein
MKHACWWLTEKTAYNAIIYTGPSPAGMQEYIATDWPRIFVTRPFQRTNPNVA